MKIRILVLVLFLVFQKFAFSAVDHIQTAEAYRHCTEYNVEKVDREMVTNPDTGQEELETTTTNNIEVVIYFHKYDADGKEMGDGKTIHLIPVDGEMDLSQSISDETANQIRDAIKLWANQDAKHIADTE